MVCFTVIIIVIYVTACYNEQCYKEIGLHLQFLISFSDDVPLGHISGTRDVSQ